MKRVLVMGGAGFLGTHLCDSLLKKNVEVFCIDNLSTGNISNLEHLIPNSSFHFIEHDVRTKFVYNVDTIFNLACPASPPRYQLNPVGTMLTNFQGTFHGLELARELGAQFIQASTSEIYGNPTSHPQKESYWGNVNPVGPRSCYDEGKRAAETLSADYKNQHRVNTKIVRIFNTYGPGMALDDGRVVTNFIMQALDGKDLTIYGDGSQSRSLCFVSDLIDGFLKVANTMSDIQGPVNLGNPEEITMLKLAELILQLTKSDSKLKFLQLPIDDPVRRQPDIEYARQILQWEPRVSIIDGLTRTIQYFKGCK